MKIDIIDEKRFSYLQKKVEEDLLLTPDNLQQKILDIPKIYVRYHKLYASQSILLKNIETEIKKTKSELYHKYKFKSDFAIDTMSERMMYVEGDTVMCDLNILYNEQESVVEFLKNTISEISKLSFLIKSYVDLEKLRNGVMV